MDAHPQESQPRRTLWTALVIVAVLVVAVVVFMLMRSQDSDEPETEPTSTSSMTTPESAAGAGVEVLEQYAGLPEGATETDEIGAVVMTDDGTIHVFTTGSSTCPAIPTAVVVDGDEIVVTVAADDSGPCTMDLVPTTSVIEIPDDYQGAGSPVVRVEQAGM